MTEDRRPLVHMDEHRLREDAQDYGLADELFDLETFKKRLRIVTVRYEKNDEGDALEFDMIGVHPSFANAIRRTIHADVPSMAVDRVNLLQNTTVIPDEVLCHRLGLLPLRADPRIFDQYIDWDHLNENDSLEFELKVKCTHHKDIKASSSHDSKYKNDRIYSGHIKWLPKGKQAQAHAVHDIGCVTSDILIAKLQPGHEIDLTMVAVKGVGSDHDKFRPVSVATYRLLPQLRLNRVVSGEEARTLQKCFAPGVIDVDKSGNAYVKNARYDNCNRNVYQYPELRDAVAMSRVRDHYIFNIESLGAYRPDDIVIEALKILKTKCRKYIEVIEEIK